MSISHCPDVRRGCTESFETHLFRARSFAQSHGRVPRQCRASHIGPEEQHLGQWIRTVISKRRTGSDLLTDAESWAVHELVTSVPQRHEPRLDAERAPYGTLTPRELMVRAVSFRVKHGRLPRLFGVEDDAEEREAGQALNQLRRWVRGTRARDARQLDEGVVDMLDAMVPDWRGPNADASRRFVIRRPAKVQEAAA